jgi:hypothetical protein
MRGEGRQRRDGDGRLSQRGEKGPGPLSATASGCTGSRVVATWQQLCVVVSGSCVVLQILKLTPHMFAYISNQSCSAWTLGVLWWVQCSSCAGATLVVGVFGWGEASE